MGVSHRATSLLLAKAINQDHQLVGCLHDFCLHKNLNVHLDWDIVYALYFVKLFAKSRLN